MDEQKKMDYLVEHRIPHLLDSIIAKLLDAMPDDPAEYISQLPLQTKSTKELTKKGSHSSLKKAQFPAHSLSPEPGLGSSRRLSESGVRFDAEPEGEPTLGGMERGHSEHVIPMSKGELKKITGYRKEFFDSYLDVDWTAPTNVRCVHIGCIAVALSYLIHGKKSLVLEKRVTTEDVFFHSHLPLHYIGNSGITLAELYDIAVTFIQNDPRFRDTMGVQLVHFDTQLYEGEVDVNNPNPTGDRGPVVTLPAFRQAFERDNRSDRRIRVFNFDPYVAEQGTAARDDEDDEDEEEEKPKQQTQKAKRKNRGAYAVFVSYNAAKHTVELADIFIDTDIKVKYRTTTLGQMYKASCALDAFSLRPRGFIEFRGDDESFGQSEVDDEAGFRWNAPPCLDDALLEGRPSGAVGTNLADVANCISPHLIAVAWGIHIAQGSALSLGINIARIMKTGQLPLNVVCNDDMSMDQVFSYAQTFVEKEVAGFTFTRHPIITPHEDAAPSMSVQDLEEYLGEVTKANADPKEPQVVMLLNFDVNTAHNVLGLDQGCVHSHWAVFVSFDEQEQLVRVADVFPKKFCKYWQLPITRLHTAMIGKGFLLLSRSPAGQLPPFVLRRPAAARANSARPGQRGPQLSRPLATTNLVNTLEFPPMIFCVTILAAAFARMGHNISVEDVISQCGVDISFLLSDHIALHDVNRVMNYVIQQNPGLKLSATARNFDTRRDGTPHVSPEQFTSLLASAAQQQKADRTQGCLIINYNAEMVHTHEHYLQHNGGDFGIVLDYDPATTLVTLGDVNPRQFYRCWAIPAATLHQACLDADYVTKRSRGYIRVEVNPHPVPVGRAFDVRKLQNRHPFKVPVAPQLSGLAFAITELGHPCSVEDVFYTAYDILKGKAQEGDLQIGTLKSRLTLDQLVSMGNAYLTHKGLRYRATAKASTKVAAIPVAELEDMVRRGATGPDVVCAVYTCGIVHDNSQTSVGLALVKHFDEAAKVVTLTDVNPTEYGVTWSCSLSTLHQALASDTGARGLVTLK
eukprot:TRINITY_DN3719_c0_g1_i1.p1 TRINITY_DN3719_c0_g1~~TRINITY_DN3719_c0_g1_i1.p1  ORF type:complete len:1024 (+),score=126.95 TRINITY_DN3719_c0_g1_i1:37-3108(+)